MFNTRLSKCAQRNACFGPSEAASRLHLVADLSIFSGKQQPSRPPAESLQEVFTCRGSPSYFGREEKALALAVRRWNALQLEEVEEDLHLQKRCLDPHGLCQLPPWLSLSALPEP